MATPDFCEPVPASLTFPSEREAGSAADFFRGPWDIAKFWMVLDVITVLVAAVLATLYELRSGMPARARGFWNGTFNYGHSMWLLPPLLFGFIFTLIFISRRYNLYTPMRLCSILHEQRLSVQACVTSSLLFAGTLYLLDAVDVPRSIMLSAAGLVTILLSLRRLLYRLLIYRRLDRQMGSRNVLIMGIGPEARSLRHYLESSRHLGYTFKGFVDIPDSRSQNLATSDDVVCSLDTLFQHVHKKFVDEIFFTSSCERGIIQDVFARAQSHRVDLRVVQEVYDGLARNRPVEYIGQFPTIPLYCGNVPEISLMVKRTLDIVFSSLVIVVLVPVVAAIAITIKLDSPGPIFYYSERIGKKGRAFRLAKFRTMVRDAEKRHGEILHLNERDEILFKISNDPRVTKVGRFLRKYSLDELPQFFNVLSGDMSIVGPRPPLASEVQKYTLNHLRRLNVTPGITGLWQVQARQDPSFDNYISLDMTYIENWNIWLDFKIILRTIGVVLAGTGS